MPEGAWRAALFFLAYFASAGVYSTYLTVWLAHKGLSAAQIGLVMAAVNATRLFGPNLWGEVARRQGHQARVVAIGVTAAAAASGVLIVAGDALSLGLTLLAIGVMTACAISLTEAILMQLLAGDTQSYGRVRALGSLGFIAGVMGSGLLFEWIGIGGFALLYGLLLWASAVTAWRMPDVAVPERSVQHTPLVVLLGRGEVLLFFLLCFLMVVAQGPFFTFLSLHLLAQGHSKPVVSTLWAVGVIAEILVFLYVRPLRDTRRIQEWMLIAFVLTGLRFLLTAWLASSLWVMVIAQALHAFTFGVFHVCAMQRIHALFDAAHYAHAQGLYIAISYGAGGLVGALISGWLYQWAGGSLAFSFGALAAWIGAALLAPRLLQGLPR